MNARKFYMNFALLSVFGFVTLSSYAQDRLFTYTYQSTVLNKGQREVEVWNTLRLGKSDYFSRLDTRSEFEMGLGGRLQTAFYLNLTSKTMSADSGKALSNKNEFGFSNEWKFKLLDPVANPVGMALYAEYGIGTSEYELEGKLIIDKKINDFTLAANAVFEEELEPEPENGGIEWEMEKKMEYYLGLAYSFSPNFHIALENAWKNVYEDGELEHSALFMGPGFSYSNEKFWINFTAMPQVKSLKGATDGSLNLSEYEKIQLRLLFSFIL